MGASMQPIVPPKQPISADEAHRIDASAGKQLLIGLGMCLVAPLCPPVGIIGAGVFVSGFFRVVWNGYKNN